jgi:hypothetical protein
MLDHKKSTARMEEELENLCERISLIDRDKAGLTIYEGEIAEGQEKGERCLVGKIGVK